MSGEKEEQLKLLCKYKKTFRSQLEKCSELEIQVKNWLTNHRNMDTSISTKMVVFLMKRWETTNRILDFTISPL